MSRPMQLILEFYSSCKNDHSHTIADTGAHQEHPLRLCHETTSNLEYLTIQWVYNITTKQQNKAEKSGDWLINGLLSPGAAIKPLSS